MTEFKTKLDIDTDNGLLEKVSCTFDIELETYPKEPYSNGSSRSERTDVYADLSYIEVGQLLLLGSDVTEWLGESRVDALEKLAAEKYASEELENA